MTFTLPVAAPFRLDLTAWVLRRRERNAIDRWDGRSYSRVIVLDETPVKLTVTQTGSAGVPQVTSRLQSNEELSAPQCARAQTIISKLLGLAVDVRPFYTLASGDAVLQPLAQPFAGIRPPRFPTLFEALVNAIACQQVSLDAGITLLSRLSEKFGVALTDDTGVRHAFPRPEDVFDVPEASFRQLGFSRQKTRAIKELAYDIVNGSINLEQLDSASNEQALAALQAIRGIGRWSAEYVLLRGLGRLDVFPGDDIGGQNNVQQLLGLKTRPSYDQLMSFSAAWYPYGGFVYFHLLLHKLSAKGVL